MLLTPDSLRVQDVITIQISTQMSKLMKMLFTILLCSTASLMAQNWYTFEKGQEINSSIEKNELITRLKIKILPPPQITSIEVSWDRMTANWVINLKSSAVLDKIYKPCHFEFDGWTGYTVKAGDLNDTSFLMLFPKSYTKAISIRDALIKLHKLKPDQVHTEDQDAEKKLFQK